jgi:hypothetical protein
MSYDHPKSDELFLLLAELVDGALTGAQASRLRELLRDDPGAQDLYRSFMSVHAQLHLDYSAGSTPVAMPGGSSMPAAPAAPPDPTGGELFGGPARPWPPSPAIGGAVAASLLAIGLAAALWPRDRREGPASAAARPTTKVASAPKLALVIKLDGVRWESDGGPPPAEGEVVSSRRLRLVSGRATLAFLSGVTLTMEGPADVDLVAIDRVFCRRGKLRARVPEGAEGFVVAAPGSAVADLGTEFAINVEDDGRARVMVFEGEAEAAVLDEEGTPERSQLVSPREAFDIDPRSGAITEAVAIGAESFVTSPVLVPPSLALDPSYPASVLGLGPWGYWRFEAMADGAVPNAISGGPSLCAFGSVGVAIAGDGNGCIAFPDGDSNRYLTLDGSWPLPKDPGYAVELWALPQEFDHATLLALRVKPSGGTFPLHYSLLELTAPRRHPLWKPASVRLLHRWPPGAGGGTNVFSDRLYSPYRWHHLVAQKNGDRMELYMDGALEHALPLDPGHSTAPCEVLIGQMTTGQGARPFFGRIDELALYDRPLTAEEIRGHFRLANPKAGPG